MSRWILLVGVGAGISLAVAEEERPNILFVFSDDHTTQALSAYGHPLELLETPNMDRLAEEGMLFERCLVTNSICGPARAAILTGKYSHENGFYMNGNRFDGSQATFPKLLQGAGYETAIFGKWHLASDPTGFDEWHILPGQGDYYNPPMIDNGERVVHEGYTSDVITDLTIEWLKERDDSKPFMLMSQHKAPHRAWDPAPRHLGFDDDREYPLAETLFDDHSGLGGPERNQDMSIAETMNARDLKLKERGRLTPEQLEAWRGYYEPRNREMRSAGLEGRELVEWKYQRYLHDYLACVKAVDENLGRLLEYLEESGLAENTVVVYSSDQGFYLGEHGWFDKRWIYEESLTTPLLARWPGVIEPGSRCGELVSNLDFARTFLDIAGVEAPAEMRGASLVPLMRGKTPEDWREDFYYHYYEFPGAHSVRRHYGVVTDRYKLFHFYEEEVDEWRLIDREKDPHEIDDKYGDEDYAGVQEELHARLAALREELEVPPASEDPVRKR